MYHKFGITAVWFLIFLKNKTNTNIYNIINICALNTAMAQTYPNFPPKGTFESISPNNESSSPTDKVLSCS